MIEAKIIADSISRPKYGEPKRIVTFELQYPRFIHGEVMTHRVFSRNAMSSRAIPVAKMIAQVRDNPAMPVHWGKNQPGMQANEQVSPDVMENAKSEWLVAAKQAADQAEVLNSLGLHKQIVNRILEPFQWMRTLVTATEWDNFFELRAHPDAQPEFQALANRMQEAMSASGPVARSHGNYLEDSIYTWGGFEDHNCWHLPYVLDDEREQYDVPTLCKISTARCARVSYLTHGGEKPVLEKDLELYNRLVGSVPIHASPTEHAALALDDPYERSKNFLGWLQYRAIVEDDI